MIKKGKSQNTKTITITMPYWLYVWAVAISASNATLAVISVLENHSPLWVIGMAFLVIVSIITAVKLILILAKEDNRYRHKT